MDNYRLTLPQHSWTGQCVHTAPVQFLVDSSASCGLTMSEDMCRADSSLSALMYVRATDVSEVSCLRPLHVLSDHSDGSVVKVMVNYLCIPGDSALVASYVKQLEPQQPLSSYTKHLFGRFKLNDDDCHFDEYSGAFVCGDRVLSETPTSDLALPPRCSWDNGFVNPRSPKYDDQFKMCLDAVVDVRYEFSWAGTSILYLNATVILADVPVFPIKPFRPIATKMNQMFTVKFVHSGRNGTSDTPLEHYNGTSYATPKRSGNPGMLQI